MLAHSKAPQAPPGNLRSNSSKATRVLVGKLPTIEVVVGERRTAKNVVNVLYPNANTPESATKPSKAGRIVQLRANTSKSVQPWEQEPSCAAHSSGTGCGQNNPGANRSRNAGNDMRPMASTEDILSSAPSICFSTRSQAPKRTERTHKQVPKTKLPLAAKLPSIRAVTVVAAQSTPRSMKSHSSGEMYCALRDRACKSAVARGVQARMT
mmetsp:Transcript_21479/g.64470  ORF Transcript_21479/g.64470 Transcript_21479/m.64470 type:complete len:210 (+) Transcript_21479:122-751(+)